MVVNFSKKVKISILLIIFFSASFAWCPWITENYAKDAVNEKLENEWSGVADGASWNITGTSKIFFGTKVYVVTTGGFPRYDEPQTKNETYFVSCFGVVSKM
ncbi:MAG: hypothetical protein CVT48_06115 [Thermoplasmata archaeon HGW-Thermoplasmata-1]|nr:MAG: hypothetical protein CVT48_06115 [Thermoplasmata archaeon HGW-Thermoplasmata-1]